MTVSDEQLSAFIDGELASDEADAVRAALARDPVLQQRLQQLLAGDSFAVVGFRSALAEPMPAGLVRAIEEAPAPADATPTPSQRPGERIRSAVALSLALLVAGFIGVGLGYMVQGPPEPPAPAPTASPAPVGPPPWLAQIADYHRIYAKQKRHLVEVPAAEKSHIEQWLAKTVGLPFRVPDLTEQGLDFAGARLLVADAKPVAQLLYTSPSGAVVGICFTPSDKPAAPFVEREVGGLGMVVWWRGGFGFVVVGDQTMPELRAAAEAASGSL